MFDTLEACASAWERAGNHGGYQARIERNLRWARYYSCLAGRRQDADYSIESHAAEVVTTLFSQGVLAPDSSVLDVGSGVGSYAAAFASRCADVTALDMDAASLSVLRERAARLGLHNITCAESMWETFEPARKFSFVFSAMCPAVCDYRELCKMESLAERACGIVTVTRGSCDLHRKRLMELLGVRPSGGMVTEALWYYEVLYLAGKHPDVQNWSQRFESAAPVEEACRQNEIYFEIFGVPAERSHPLLQEYFRSQAKDGLVSDEIRLNTALITWNV